MSENGAGCGTYDVVIVGAGPVGVTLAALLGQAGVSCFLGERSAAVYPLPRAAHFDHEVMRVFQQLDIVDPVLEAVTPARRYVFQNAAGEVLIEFDQDEPGVSGWHGYMIHQPGIERALRDRLARDPHVTFRTSVEFVGQSAEEDGTVTSRWAAADGDVLVRSRFLIGCDGAWSPVRETIGGGIDDLGFDEPWLVLDLEVEEANNLPTHNIQYCDPDRPTTYCVMGNRRRRFEFMLRDGETPVQVMQDDAIHAMLAKWDITGLIAIERKAVYRFHALVAGEWRDGPILLAGDAAHQMPPFAGQGMCSGIRDAVAIAWRIALIKAGADPALLDGYQVEREPHVRTIIASAIATGRVVCTVDPAMASARDEQMLAARAAGLPPPDIRSPHLTVAFGLPDTARAGMLFPQPLAQVDGATVRLDDVLGLGAWLITRAGPVTADELPLRVVDLADGALAPFRAALEAWLDAAGASAVLVRADRYVFGTGEAALLASAFAEQAGFDPASPKSI